MSKKQEASESIVVRKGSELARLVGDGELETEGLTTQAARGLWKLDQANAGDKTVHERADVKAALAWIG